MTGYFNSGNPKIDDLVNGIIVVTKEHIDDPEAVITALQLAFVFHMSVVCRDCRKNIGRKLKRDIPGMMAEAAMLASSVSDELPAKHDTTH
jgi:hypothetical protein